MGSSDRRYAVTVGRAPAGDPWPAAPVAAGRRGRSGEEFKASVLGAYERGERAISVARLQRLARFYGVPGRPAPARATTVRPSGPGPGDAGIDAAVAPAGRRVHRRCAIALGALSRVEGAAGRAAHPVRPPDPGAAGRLQRPGAHGPPRRPAGPRLHPRRHAGAGAPPASRSSASPSSAVARPDGQHGAVPFGLYVHVPFCAARCDYCSFATWTDRHHLTDAYLGGVPRRRRPPGGRRACPRSPRCSSGAARRRWCPPADLWRCSTACRGRAGCEVTVECNPDDVYRRAGRRLPRRRGEPDLARRAVDLAPTCSPRSGAPTTAATSSAPSRSSGAPGSPTFNLDLIYGGAGETLDDWCRTLDDVARAGPAARVRVRAHRRGGHAAGRRPRPPPRRRRPGRQVPRRHRAARRGRARLVRDLELGRARPRVPPQPPLLDDGRVPGARLRRPLAPRRPAVLEPAHPRPLHRRRRATGPPWRRPTSTSTTTGARSRRCSSCCAPAQGVPAAALDARGAPRARRRRAADDPTASSSRWTVGCSPTRSPCGSGCRRPPPRHTASRYISIRSPDGRARRRWRWRPDVPSCAAVARWPRRARSCGGAPRPSRRRPGPGCWGCSGRGRPPTAAGSWSPSTAGPCRSATGCGPPPACASWAPPSPRRWR